MSRTCLVTGGAGFIGCAVSSGLADEFDSVVAVDCLHPQIHASRARPLQLDDRVDLWTKDVTKREDWDSILDEIHPDVIIHLAAETGTGQSLREASRHAEVNVLGTTQMLDSLVRHDALPEKIVLTSSRAVYGEGRWKDAEGHQIYPGQRTHKMLATHQWDFAGMTPLPQQSATVAPSPANVYASTKLCQENLISSWCGSFGVVPVLYRLQNVYGVGQSLVNPYTGIVSLFARLASTGKSIPVYEDGNIVRDFVYIDDVSAALLAGVVRSGPNTTPYDIGLGERTTIMTIARTIAKYYHAPEPHITNQFRDGDVRAAWADISVSTRALNWRPRISVEEGVSLLCDWISSEPNRATTI